MEPTNLQTENSEAWFRTLLDTAPDAMIIVDAEGTITTANNQAQRMFGYSQQELQGQKIEMLLPAAIRRRHTAHRAGYVKNPSVRPMGAGLELVGLRKSGEEFPVEISLSPVSAGAGPYVSSVIRDVTERKKMEQEIIAARQAAERANKANSAFLAAASHDLRQPVQALSLLNGALRRTVKDEGALEIIANQEHSLTAMTNLLNSLLDISRLEAGAITAEIENFPIQKLIDRLSAEFTRQAAHKGLEFKSESCSVLVQSDPNLLAEIIQNLVSNGIRYTEHGSVTLRCVVADGACSLLVEDTGIGIESHQLEEIFREFHQLESQGGDKEGFGLGLAIVRRLADLLGHEISVESTPGRGSCFSLSLPLLQDAGANPPVHSAADSVAEDAASGLVVLLEDNRRVAKALEMLLEAEGYQVGAAASVAEVRLLIEQLSRAPALIIADFHLLGGSTGIEAVRTVRDHFQKKIPAFIVSGDTSKIVHDARLVDNCILMSKPVDTTELLAAASMATRSGQVPD